MPIELRFLELLQLLSQATTAGVIRWEPAIGESRSFVVSVQNRAYEISEFAGTITFKVTERVGQESDGFMADAKDPHFGFARQLIDTVQAAHQQRLESNVRSAVDELKARLKAPRKL